VTEYELLCLKCTSPGYANQADVLPFFVYYANNVSDIYFGQFFLFDSLMSIGGAYNSVLLWK
jgi:hypothetical protein